MTQEGFKRKLAAIMHYAREGYNRVINVKPLLSEMGNPYLDTPYDGSSRPGRETAIRTFMYQASQHQYGHGRIGFH